MSRIGADIEGMSQLHGQLQQKAQQVQALRSQLTNLVQSTYWEGPAAQRFKEAWNSQYNPSLTKLEQALNELGNEVRNRKEALVQVSS